MNDNLRYRCREESDGMISLMPKRGANKNSVQFLNRTARDVLFLFEEGKTVSQIVDALCAKYTKGNPAQVTYDVLSCLALLNYLEVLDIKKRKAAGLDHDPLLEQFLVQDEQFPQIAQRIKEAIQKKGDSIVLLRPDMIYTPQAIRTRNFHLLECFFQSDNPGDGIISILNLFPMARIVEIGIIVVSRNGFVESATRLFQKTEQFLKMAGVKKTRIKLAGSNGKIIPKKILSHPEFPGIIEAIGYQCEGILKDELDENVDVHLFSKIV